MVPKNMLQHRTFDVGMVSMLKKTIYIDRKCNLPTVTLHKMSDKGVHSVKKSYVGCVREMLL